MPSRILASINPATLAWVREGIGIPSHIAAARIGVSPERLEAFERGTAQPTIGQLRTIGRVYKRPAAFFYLANLPERNPPLPDYRRLPNAEDLEQLPELVDAIEAARIRRLAALELTRSLGRDLPVLGVHVGMEDSPQEIAQRLRERLGITLGDQRAVREKYRVLRMWTAAIEAHGVLVSQFSGVDVDVARGFSLSDQPLPLISVNGKDSPRAKVFTLFHELVHIALGAGGLCDLHDSKEPADRIEPFCNRVAAEFLVPSAALLLEPLIQGITEEAWEDWRLLELATSFGVSTEVILRRLLTLGRTTEGFYRLKREQAQQALESAAAVENSGFIEYFRRILRDNGAAFTSLVLDAYRSDLVSPTEVSRLLGGMKLTHLPAIENALEGAGA